MSDPSPVPARLVRFGVFELDLRVGELRKAGVRLNLPDQPYQLLAALLERPGELVTREELRPRLWPSNTFVDFEHGLNAAVKRLRDVLGDSADTPRFVETMPRRGYRFIAPVESEPPVADRATAGPGSGDGARSISPVIDRLLRRCFGKDVGARVQHMSTVDQMLGQAHRVEPKLRVFRYTGGKLKFAAVVAGGALTAVVVALVMFPVRNNGRVQPPIAATPVHRQLTFVGDVGEAALSPDGRSFAYVSANRLLLQEISGGPPAELVRADVALEGIAQLRWSPRGDRVAFVSYHQQQFVLQVVSTHGGRPLRVDGVTPSVSSAWSPDGLRMALTGEDFPGGFTIIDVRDGRDLGAVRLPGFHHAHDINWHPKLDRLALLEHDPGERWVIWIAAPDGREARPVYTEAQAISSMCWSPTENRLYFLRSQNEATDLVVLDLGDTRSPTSRVLISGLPAGGSLTISADGRSLLHVRGTATANLARLDLTRPGNPMEFITHGTRRFSSPRVSPDGQWIAAVVGAAPRTRIVKLPFPGGEVIPLTSGDYFDGAPVWSPDGTSIAFASVRAGTDSVWLMRPDGTQLEQLKNSTPSENHLTSWTPDGRLMWQEIASMDQMNFRIRDLSSGNDSFLFSEKSYGWVFVPEFAPSGQEFAVFWNRWGGPRGLYVLSWPALVPRLLREGTYWPVGWSADGASVIAEGERDVWLVSKTHGKSKSLMRVPLATGSRGHVSPDGKYLVTSVAATTADAWLIQDFDPQGRTRH